MSDCKFCECEFSQGIEHTVCTNEELKRINKSKNGKNIPCVKTSRTTCGNFEPKDTDSKEETEK